MHYSVFLFIAKININLIIDQTLIKPAIKLMTGVMYKKEAGQAITKTNCYQTPLSIDNVGYSFEVADCYD